MVDFLEQIEDRIKCDEFYYYKPEKIEDAVEFILQSVSEEGNKILLKGDWDVDGVFSAKIIYNVYKDYFERKGLDVDDYVVSHFGSQKDHGVSNETVLKLNEGFSHLIIVDSSTNNMDTLRVIANRGIKVLIIDHHIAEYNYSDYPENVIIINSKMPGNESLYEISAGFLCHIFSVFARTALNLFSRTEDIVFGYVTLITDGCNLNDDYIKPVILKEQPVDRIPPEIKLFMTQWDKLCRKFVSYRLGNKINFLTRMDDEEAILDIFFRDIEYTDKLNKIKEIDEKQKEFSKETRRIASDYLMFSKDYGSSIVMDLDLVRGHTFLPLEYLINATGLFAMEVVKLTNRPTFAIISKTDTEYKASGRCGNQLFQFERMCKALDLKGGGHPSAYGFEIPKYEYGLFEDYLVNCSVTEIKKTANIFSLRDTSALSIPRIFLAVSRYNEIACKDILPIYLKIRLVNCRRNVYGKLTVYDFETFKVKDLKSETNLGDEVLIEPVFNSKDEALVVY